MARYVNDVHLPRFRIAPLYGTATHSQMHCGRSKGFLPSNSWNNSTNGGRVSIAAIDNPYSILYNTDIN